MSKHSLIDSIEFMKSSQSSSKLIKISRVKLVLKKGSESKSKTSTRSSKLLKKIEKSKPKSTQALEDTQTRTS